jgi:RNA polymerase sigma factor (sigma-70 family)
MDKPVRVDDTLLLKRIARRDRYALSALYDRYARIIYGLAFKSLGSVEESEELVLDVFTQIWRIADRYDPQKGRVDTWLFTLARSRIIDRAWEADRVTELTDAELEKIRGGMTPTDSNAIAMRIIGGRGGGTGGGGQTS